MTPTAKVALQGPRKWRSMLYVPANRPDLIAKQERFGADVVVLDLEDGTPESEKARARETLADAVPALRASSFRGTVLVRVNSFDARELHEADIESVRDLDIDGVVLPKAESVAAVHALTDSLGGPGRQLIVLGFETVAGVRHVDNILGECEGIDAAYFGGEDYIADLGGRRTPSGEEILYPRSQVSIACRIHGVAAIDTVVLSFDSAETFAQEAAIGRNLGYGGKLCIHPAQVAWTHAVFTPSDDEVARAERLLAAYEDARRAGLGTLNFEGQMVDTPLVLQAQRVLNLAGSSN